METVGKGANEIMWEECGKIRVKKLRSQSRGATNQKIKSQNMHDNIS